MFSDETNDLLGSFIPISDKLLPDTNNAPHNQLEKSKIPLNILLQLLWHIICSTLLNGNDFL